MLEISFHGDNYFSVKFGLCQSHTRDFPISPPCTKECTDGDGAGVSIQALEFEAVKIIFTYIGFIQENMFDPI